MIEKHKDYIKVEGNSELFENKYGFKDINFDDLIQLYRDDDYIPYAQYLRTTFWKIKRLEILERDNFRCQHCGGYETMTRKNSTETEWSDIEAIFWTHLNGN